MSSLNDDQKDEINEAISYMFSVRDVLELHELRLDNFGNVKLDPSASSSIDISDATDAISLARSNLADAIDLLQNFTDDQ